MAVLYLNGKSIPSYSVGVTVQGEDKPETFKLNQPLPLTHKDNPFNVQVGGDHYKNQDYQTVEFLLDVDANYCLGSAIKYVVRYGSKEGNNPKDLEKAIHYLYLFKEYLLKKVDVENTEVFQAGEYDAEAIMKFTHQFEPKKAIVLQKICQLFTTDTDEEHIIDEDDIHYKISVKPEFFDMFVSAVKAIQGLADEDSTK